MFLYVWNFAHTKSDLNFCFSFCFYKKNNLFISWLTLFSARLRFRNCVVFVVFPATARAKESARACARACATERESARERQEHKRERARARERQTHRPTQICRDCCCCKEVKSLEFFGSAAFQFHYGGIWNFKLGTAIVDVVVFPLVQCNFCAMFTGVDRVFFAAPREIDTRSCCRKKQKPAAA